MFQPVGGMEQLPKAIARNLPEGMIRFSTEVQRIRQTAKKVTVDVIRDGQPESFTADWCVCTIPLSVLKGIDNGLSPAFKEAMAKCAYVPVGKIGLQMKRRFWEEDESIFGGGGFSALPFRARGLRGRVARGFARLGRSRRGGQRGQRRKPGRGKRRRQRG